MHEEHTTAPEPDASHELGSPEESDGLLIVTCLVAALLCGLVAFFITYFSTDQGMVGLTTILIFGAFVFFGVGLLVPLFRNSESPAAAIVVLILYTLIAFGLAIFASSIAGWAIYSNSLG